MKKTVSAFVFTCLVSGGVFAGNPSSIGDVVSRSLNISGLGWAGHIGMYTGSNIIEVLNATPVIQVNTLNTFKAQSTYFGARYGKGFNFSTMINTGMTEKSYGANYTITTSAYPSYLASSCIQYGPSGQCMKYSTYRVRGQWRCDTFVNYIYKAGTGQNIASISTPSSLYDSYPYQR